MRSSPCRAGIGTAEEFFEALTWAQLGLHAKPCGLLNVHGYFDDLIRFVDHAVHEQFIDSANRGLLLVDDSPEGAAGPARFLAAANGGQSRLGHEVDER